MTFVKAVFAALWIMLLAVPASAQNWPNKPVHLVVPFAPGGSTDFWARLVGQKLHETFGQSFVVENKAGAGGAVGAGYVAKAPPDGYTLLVHSWQFILTPALDNSLGYDPIKNFVGIAPLAYVPNVLVASSGSFRDSFKAVSDIVSYGKANPKKLKYGHSDSVRINVEKFHLRAGFEATGTRYQTAQAALAAVAAGEIDYAFVPADVVKSAAERDREKVRLLAVGASTRFAGLPTLPTTVEAGLPGSDHDYWIGLLAPAGTPREIVSRLNQEIGKILQAPDIKDRLGQMSAVPMSMTSEQFTSHIAAGVREAAEIVKTAKIEFNQPSQGGGMGFGGSSSSGTSFVPNASPQYMPSAPVPPSASSLNFWAIVAGVGRKTVNESDASSGAIKLASSSDNRPPGTESFRLPPDFRNDNGAQQREQACDSVTKEWQAILDLVEQGKQPETAAVRKAYPPYEKNCLAPVAQLPADVLKAVTPAIGALFYRQTGEIHCSATRVSRTRVVTARHCVYDTRNNDVLTDSFEFRSLAEPRKPLNLKSTFWPARPWQPATFDKRQQANDYLVAEIENPDAFDPTIVFGPPEMGTPLYIAAPSLGVALMERLTALSDWPSSFRFAPGRTCIPTAFRASQGGAEPACLMHACQTASTMSGAGIFQRVKGEIRMVGIHLGSPSPQAASAGACRQLIPATEVNVGRYLSSELKDAIAKLR